jgi:hypothetical protein
MLMIAFEVGVAGCVLLIPVVAFKFIAVLFEKDLVAGTPGIQE